MKLNPEQQLAKEHGEGACLISAGPGSGKTETMSQRYVKLVSDGVRPERMLFVTFTNRAAREMRSRVRGKVGNLNPRTLWIGTFHGMCVRMLKRIDADFLDGRTRDFAIYNQNNSKSLVREAMNAFEESRPKNKREREGGPGGLLDWIEDKKRRMLHPDDVEPSEDGDDIKRLVWKLYETKLRQANAFDFTDLLGVTTRLAESATSVGAKLRNLFDYVMVDEYQDTNEMQFRLVQALGSLGNVTVVGDVDQSIYAFRGAQPSNIIEFQNAHEGCTVIRLQTNYRSTGAVVAFCNSLIATNTMRDQKVMHSNNESGELPRVIRFDSGESEAREVARQVGQLIANGVPPGEIGIMYRQHRLSRSVEGALRDGAIDYMMVAGLEFYERKEVMELLAHLALLVHPESRADYRRVACQVPGISDGTVNKLLDYADHHRLTPVAASVLYATQRERTQKRSEALVRLGRFLEEATAHVGKTTDLAELGAWVLSNSGVLARYQAEFNAVSGKRGKHGSSEENKARAKVENLKEVVSAIRAYAERTVRQDETPTLSGYLESVALMTQGDDAEGDRVKLLTIHAAKGLQFYAGFVIGVDHGICPPDGPLDLLEREEERRCLYVAASRAKKVLVLSTAAYRYLYGRDMAYQPSEFLADVDETLYLAEDGRRPVLRGRF